MAKNFTLLVRNIDLIRQFDLKKRKIFLLLILANGIHQRAHRGVRKCHKIGATIDRAIGSQHTMGGSQSRYNSRLVEEIYRVAIKTRRI